MCSERPLAFLPQGRAGGGGPDSGEDGAGAWGTCSLVQLWPPCLPRSGGGPRKGYMGHLTRVANALVQNVEKGPNAEQLGQLLKGEGQGSPPGWSGWGPRGRLMCSSPPL